MRADDVAYDLARRFEARQRRGLLSGREISRLIGEYLQTLAAESGELNRVSGRRRGAPLGNENRRIHGLYSQDAKRLEAGIRVLEALMGYPVRKRARSI